MDYVKLLVLFAKTLGYTVYLNVFGVIPNKSGNTNARTKEICIFSNIIKQQKNSVISVLSHEVGHAYHVEKDLEGTRNHSKEGGWELAADLFSCKVSKFAGEQVHDLRDKHIVLARVQSSNSDIEWANEISSKAFEAFKKFVKTVES